jgi:hypothetical protein
MSDHLELGPFDIAGDACRSLVPAELGDLHLRAHRYGIKVWFDAPAPTREHYEAQIVNARFVPGARSLGVEVGFHAEHPKVAANDAVITQLARVKRKWRRILGDAAEVGPFLGRADTWRRISETWADPDLSDPDVVMDLALRLVDYVRAIEPLRRT